MTYRSTPSFAIGGMPGEKSAKVLDFSTIRNGRIARNSYSTPEAKPELSNVIINLFPPRGPAPETASPSRKLPWRLGQGNRGWADEIEGDMA